MNQNIQTKHNLLKKVINIFGRNKKYNIPTVIHLKL